MSDPITLHQGETWLAGEWTANFTQTLESMLDEKPSTGWSAQPKGDLGPNALLVEYRLASFPEPLLWIGVPEETWKEVGGRVLRGAGVETVSDDESRGTFLEIIQQSTAGFAQALSGRLGREIAPSGSREPESFPQALAPIHVSIQSAGKEIPPVWIGFSNTLSSWLVENSLSLTDETGESTEENSRIPAGAASSKTFDLLLDVALPVSISFGRTELPVKEVLKLTTGCIVELNRSVSEPVEVIVNNCVIARGEVVVVEGNYGVRINQIVSRQERLRTGSSSGAALKARVGSAAFNQAAIA